MNEKITLSVTAMICITILESIYLFMGHNGAVFTTVIGALCVLAGYKLHQFKGAKWNERIKDTNN